MQTLSVDQLVGQVRGNYRIERFLGKARLNAVYLARNLQSQRTDALTLYLVSDRFSAESRTRFQTRFRKEAAAITTLNHPHILPVYEYGEVAEYPYLVTPYMMNGSLADMLKQNGRYDHTTVLSLLEQLAAGLTYAHQRGFIHGTLRPSNVVMSGEETLQVAGFGLMHMLQLSGIEQSNQPYGHLFSVAGTFLAAPEYVAPEVVEGQSIDIRSDIYALGCILFELLSGRPPFTGTDPLEIAQKHVNDSIPALRTLCPDVPVALASVVNQTLERDPARRFQQVSELEEAFAQASKGAVQHSQPLQLPRQGESTTRSRELFQDTPRDGYPASKWQLLPPIVTGKMPAIKQTTQQRGGLLAKDTDAQRSIRKTNATAPYVVPAPPTLVPDEPMLPPMSTRSVPQQTRPTYLIQEEPVQPPLPVEQMPTQVSPPRPAPPPAPTVQTSLPGGQQDASTTKDYEWWSQPGEIEPAPAPVQSAPRQQPARATMQPPPQPPLVRSQEPLTLQNPDALNWSMDMPMPPSMPQKRRSPARQSANAASRRKVVTLLATGGVLAAGVAVGVVGINAFANKGAPTTTQTAQTQPNTTTAKKNTTQPPAQASTTAAKANTPAATNPQQNQGQQPQGHMIGLTSQAPNSAFTFTNPADNKTSFLIHLPDKSFVAYEVACTHENVPVNYDPTTKKLVCPAHGAIFDPANKGAVVQGPATKPLPMVTIHVNTNGTITA